MTTITSRRAILAGATLAIVPAAAGAAFDRDQVVLDRVSLAIQKEREASENYDTYAAVRDERVWARATWPENQNHWTDEDRKAYWTALCEEEPKVDGLRDAHDKVEAACNGVDAVVKQMTGYQPATPAGIAALALIAAWANPKLWDHDDWEDVQMHRLFDAIFAASGIENIFKAQNDAA
jgi:hypothetical protein